jgi:hypothetical protein
MAGTSRRVTTEGRPRMRWLATEVDWQPRLEEMLVRIHVAINQSIDRPVQWLLSLSGIKSILKLEKAAVLLWRESVVAITRVEVDRLIDLYHCQSP